MDRKTEMDIDENESSFKTESLETVPKDEEYVEIDSNELDAPGYCHLEPLAPRKEGRLVLGCNETDVCK